jgi:hypothetical protein
MAEEAKLERYLRQEAKARGYLCWKFLSPGLRGVPDRAILAPFGVVVFAEVKAPGQKPRPDQIRRINEIREKGNLAYVIDCKSGVARLMSAIELEVERKSKAAQGGSYPWP